MEIKKLTHTVHYIIEFLSDVYQRATLATPL